MKLTYNEEFDDDLELDFDGDDGCDPEISEMFAKDLQNVLYDILNIDSNIQEEFVSGVCLRKHFSKHCIGNSDTKQSKRSKVYYDFDNNSKYSDYEKQISRRIEDTDYRIGSLYDYNTILKYLRKLFEGDVCILFCNSCGLDNGGRTINVAILSFSSEVTTNYNKGNTVDICVRTASGKTITLYPVDANYLQNKLNNIIKEYSKFEDVEQYNFNND